MNLKRSSLLIFWALYASLFTSCSNDVTPKNNGDNFEVDFVKTLGGSKNESAQAITKTQDGGYAILGFAQSIDGDISNKTNDSFDYWLLKFDANDNLQWQKTYGGSDNDRGSDIVQTNDGGYAIFGFSQSNDTDVTENAGASDFWISKLDAFGNISWEKSFGFAGADNGISLIQTNDNGYLLTGVLDVSASGGLGNSKTTHSKHAGGDYWAIKLNASGDEEWFKFFGGSFTDTPYDVIQTDDNGYIIVGSSDSDDVDIKANNGSYDFWVIKISETGTLIWEKSFGGSQIDEARAITNSGDGNYIIVGDTRSNDLDVSSNNGAADLWIIKISPTGNLIWEKSFGGNSFDVGKSISKTQDNGFIISGNSRSSNGDITANQGQNDAWVLKINTNADIKWQKTIGGSDIDFAFDAIELNDKSIIIVGESSSSDIDIPNNKGFTDLLIIKIE
jgi:hypothetical protein